MSVEGMVVGAVVGMVVGAVVGAVVGLVVGAAVGCVVGAAVLGVVGAGLLRQPANRHKVRTRISAVAQNFFIMFPPVGL